MSNQDPVYVVKIANTSMYLIGYNFFSPPQSTFGNLENALEYPTLAEAEAVAAKIGPGTIGLPRP